MLDVPVFRKEEVDPGAEDAVEESLIQVTQGFGGRKVDYKQESCE